MWDVWGSRVSPLKAAALWFTPHVEWLCDGRQKLRLSYSSFLCRQHHPLFKSKHQFHIIHLDSTRNSVCSALELRTRLFVTLKTPPSSILQDIVHIHRKSHFQSKRMKRPEPSNNILIVCFVCMKSFEISHLAGHLEVVKLLVASGAEVDCKDKKAYTPLHAAASSGMSSTVHYLLGLGVQVGEARSATVVSGHRVAPYKSFCAHAQSACVTETCVCIFRPLKSQTGALELLCSLTRRVLERGSTLQ